MNEEKDFFHFIYKYSIIRDCKHYIAFAIDIPSAISINKPNHEMTIDRLCFPPFNDEKRYALFYSKQLWSSFSEIPGRDIVTSKIPSGNPIDVNVMYQSTYTKLTLLVEIHDNEIDSVIAVFKDRDFRSKLLIRIMSVLEIKMIETLGSDFGAEYLKFGAERAFLYEIGDDVDEVKLIGGIETCSYGASRPCQLQHGSYDNMFSDKGCVWRYFANKCEICFSVGNSLECILFAAIAIESYVHQLLVDNNLFEKFQSLSYNEHELINSLIKDYDQSVIGADEFVTQIIESKRNKPYTNSVFSEVDFLQCEGVITKQEKESIKKHYGKIKDLRNDIVHGNIDSILIEETAAHAAYKGIVELFSNIPFPKATGKQENYQVIEQHMSDAINAVRSGDLGSYENFFLSNIENNVYVCTSSYYLGKIYYLRNKLDKAKELFLTCYNKRRYRFQSTCFLGVIAHKQKQRDAFMKYKAEATEMYNVAINERKDNPSLLKMYTSFYDNLIALN